MKRHPKHHLAAADPILAAVIKKIELRPRRARASYFHYLVNSIISQQLSTKAADTILRRFVALYPGQKFPTPGQVARTSDKKLRAVGLSFQKVSYIKDLARRVDRRQLNFRRLARLSEEEIILELTAVRGIGQWTAEMFLMFALQRPDIFSYGDLGLRNAIQKLYKLRAHPTPKQAERITARWKPYRTLASRYLWASLEVL